MRNESFGAVTAWDDLALEKITALISRKLVSGDGQMLAQVYLKRGALVPLHAHDGEQMIYVLDGMLKLRVSGEDLVVGDGEVVRIPGRAPHQIEALADTFALDLRSSTPTDPASAPAGGQETAGRPEEG